MCQSFINLLSTLVLNTKYQSQLCVIMYLKGENENIPLIAIDIFHCTYIPTYNTLGMFVYVCLYVCTCVTMYVRVYVCMYIRTYVRMYVCMFIYTCMYIDVAK